MRKKSTAVEIARTGVVVTLAACMITSCGLATNTLAQDLAWERWKQCDGKYPTVQVKEVRTDGQIWFNYSSTSDLAAVQECLRVALENQARRQAVAAPPKAVAAPTLAGEASRLQAPRLRVGDEWAFRWESPQGKGTFVWAVDREETIDGTDFYVIKSGTRESLYRKADLAFYLDRVAREVETRNTPPIILMVWPLGAKNVWDQSYIRERPAERTTEDMRISCNISEKEEIVTVPAGSFSAFYLACRNSRTNAINFEMWYAPDIRFLVKDRTHLKSGVRERELLQYRLK